MIELVSVGDCTTWRKVLDSCYVYDFYHYASYNELLSRRDGGQALLFFFSDGPFVLAVPLLVKSIASPGGCGEAVLRDASSVYGYAGPIASQANIPPDIVAKFNDQLKATLLDLNVVAVFSRLHPLFPQERWIVSLGEVVEKGQTVSIDLLEPEETSWQKYKHGHRSDIQRLRSKGYKTYHDPNMLYLEEFVKLYQETMTRLGARKGYFFDVDYFRSLLNAPENYAHLFVVLDNDTVACGAIFTTCNGIVQYHLSAASDRLMKYAPTKLMIDDVRTWSKAAGQRVMHLGGGVGAGEDKLFQFKAGFSGRRHCFRVWKWVLQPEIYRHLNHEVTEKAANPPRPASSEFFPYYRQFQS